MTRWFGENWQNYVKNIVTEKTVEEAKQSMLRYLPAEEWKANCFVDIGSGSGLFSLAAKCLGAKKVISFDYDPQSVTASGMMRNKFKDKYGIKDDDWEISEGSILDDKNVEKLKGKADIVYSWGVLHHTGNMWKAIENASKIPKKNGYFIIAIYNETASSQWWQTTKRWFSVLPDPIKLSSN